MTQQDWIIFTILACTWAVAWSHVLVRLWRTIDTGLVLLVCTVGGVVTLGITTGLIALLKDTCR